MAYLVNSFADMKKKFAFSIFIWILLSISGENIFAQANKVVITPKKVIYHRENIPKDDFKSTFTVIYPQIKVHGNQTAERKIRQNLDYEKAFDFLIKENISDYTDITSLYFKTVYNKSDILDVNLFYESLGAYPWTTKKEFIFNVKNGETASAIDCFNKSSLKTLADQVRKKLLAEIAQAQIKGTFPSESDNYKYALSNLNDFSVSQRGLIFHYDYGFNFATLSLEPKGDFFFTYHQLKPFIKADGLLGKFIR
jgi:hypothetical protein